MGLIKANVVSGTTDRIAAQHQLIRDGFEAANVSGTGFFYPRIHQSLCDDPDTPLGDADIEGVLVVPANNLDQNFLSGATLSTIYGQYLRAFRTHFSAQGVTDWNGYLSDTDVDLNVHEDFNAVYNAVFGSDLDAVNVFRDTLVELGNLSLTGSGVGTFTDGDAIGTGTGSFNADSNSAGAQLQVYMGSGATTATDLDMNLTVLNEDQSQTSNVLVTLSSGSDIGDTVDIGSSSDKVIDIVSLQFAGGDSGTVVAFRQIIEREASL